MHYAPPALFFAAVLAGTLAPAQARAPTAASSPQSMSGGRMATGVVTETFEAAAEEAWLVAQTLAATSMPEVLSDAAPLPRVQSGPARSQAGRTPIMVAQAPATGPATGRAPAVRPPASLNAAPNAAGSGTAGVLRPCSSVTVDPPTSLTLGKSQVVSLPFPVARVIVGGQPGGRAGRAAPTAAPGMPGMPGMAGGPGASPAQGAEAFDGVAETDVTLLSPTELFFLGRRTGSMNVVLQANDGRCIVKDIVVTIDPGTLQAKLTELMPEEGAVKVRGADNALVLTGAVSDSVKLSHVLALAGSYGDGRKVVNLLRVSSPQQVMLEVQIAEVSKTLLSRLGLDFSRMIRSGDGTVSVLSGILGGAPGLLARFGGAIAETAVSGTANVGVASASGTANGTAGSFDVNGGRVTFTPGTISRSSSILGIDAKKNDGIVRVLAEPNIMAISGQPASFLSGGRIFIPVAQSSGLGGAPVITLQEKEFGVSLKFTPTVLDGRINLKVVSEVSELSQTGSPFTTIGGVTSVLPSLTTRQVDTTVQLGDGQSFAVAGLIRNNMSEALNKFPGLGEAPVVGALFRSTEFQTDQSELMFVVTPRLVKPVTSPIGLPTDNHVPPTPNDAIWNGSGEGQAPAPQTPREQPVPAAAPGPTRP